MKKGVGESIFVLLLVSLLFTPGTFGIIVTPSEIELTEYDSQQETVITFYNDEAAPLKIDPIPGPHSTYLAPYTTITPDHFILEPNAQQNIKVRTKFPSTLSPQIHSLTILPDQGAQKGANLHFRPPGEQQLKLKIVSVLADMNEGGDTAVISITYKNLGNVFVFATPTVRILNDSGEQQQTTYPKPVMIMQGEEFSLDVLQDIQGMAEGNYDVEVETAYKVDEYSGFTGKERGTLHIEHHNQEQSLSTFHFSTELIYILLAGLLLVGYIYFHNKKATGSNEIRQARKQVHHMRTEVHAMADETRELIKDINDWFQQGVR